MRHLIIWSMILLHFCVKFMCICLVGTIPVVYDIYHGSRWLVEWDW